MSETSPSNETLIRALEEAEQKYWCGKERDLDRLYTLRKNARAAVLARMSSPSHERATPAKPQSDVIKHRVVYDAECIALLGMVSDDLREIGIEADSPEREVARRAHETLQALRNLLVDNELAHERAMAEGGWHPESTAPEDKMLITFRLGEEDVTRAWLRIWPEGEREWIAPDGRTTVTHHSYAPPTHWLCEAPPTPTTKEETA